MKVNYITGANKGVAWNKNRCIYYLRNIKNCDVIILLDDDVYPTKIGWEKELVLSAIRFGHVNMAFEDMIERNPGKAFTHTDPGLSKGIGGACLAFSNLALNTVGYFDPRFLRFGHEHTELSKRLLKIGFGGVTFDNGKQKEDFFLVVRSYLNFVEADSTGSQEYIDANTKVYVETLADETTYRNAWNNREDGEIFFAEQIEACRREGENFPELFPTFNSNKYLDRYPDVKISGSDAWDHFFSNGLRENRYRSNFPVSSMIWSPTIWDNDILSDGFIVGWERAFLGNCLSTYANLFALSSRTRVPFFYPQIENVKEIISFNQKFPVFFSDEQTEVDENIKNKLKLLSSKIAGTEPFDDIRSVHLDELHKLLHLRSKILFLDYHPGFMDLEKYENIIKEFCSFGNCIIIRGAYWLQYSNTKVLMNEGLKLRNHLIILGEKRAPIRTKMQSLESDFLPIGVHIRRGRDYEGWVGGKYFFSLDQYALVIKKIHDILVPSKHRFYICSDMDVDVNLFNDIPLAYEKASLFDDFAILSLCKYIVGPPSTFGTWAAFLGNAKRIVLTEERINNIEKWDSILDDAIDVIYPTAAGIPENMFAPI